MDDFERIRRLVLVEGFSQREVAKQLGVARKSIRKAIQRPYPADYTLKVPRPCPMLDSVKPIIDAWLDQDRQAPRKQRHSGARVHERLVAEHGFQGSLRSVSSYVSDRRKKAISASPSVALLTRPTCNCFSVPRFPVFLPKLFRTRHSHRHQRKSDPGHFEG